MSVVSAQVRSSISAALPDIERRTMFISRSIRPCFDIHASTRGFTLVGLVTPVVSTFTFSVRVCIEKALLCMLSKREVEITATNLDAVLNEHRYCSSAVHATWAWSPSSPTPVTRATLLPFTSG